MQPALFLITGFPGVGKLTVARALEDQLVSSGNTVRVVDNHWINNPVFGLVEQDGLTPLPAEVWDRVGEVAGAVVRTVESLTPKAWSLIFTAYLDGVTDTGWPAKLAHVASHRGSTFVPVRLLCDPDENARRIVLPGRSERMKSVDPEEPIRLNAAGSPYDMGHPDQLTLDVTKAPPSETARRIATHARSIDQNP